MTVKLNVQEALLVAQSVTVTVMGYTPGPTPVPAGGVWEQVSGPHRSKAQVRAAWHRSGMVLWHAVTVRTTGMAAELVMQAQLRTGGVVSTTVTVWLHVATFMQSSTACQVRVITCGQVPLVTVP